jgi:hypothetical protein
MLLETLYYCEYYTHPCRRRRQQRGWVLYGSQKTLQLEVEVLLKAKKPILHRHDFARVSPAYPTLEYLF